jgi:DNA-binding GntR family transcriptional regulator
MDQREPATMLRNVDFQERAYVWTRKKLVEGRVRSRRDLSRRQLAKELGVSPGSVDYALSRLEGEGLLETRPQAGTFIRQLTRDEFRDLYEVRQCIEPYAAARAAERITAAQLKRLERCYRAMTALHAELEAAMPNALPPDYVGKSIRLEHEFHGAIMEAAGNREATRIIENARILLHVLQTTTQWPLEAFFADMVETLAQHRSIIDALRERDPALARQRMDHHLRTGFTAPNWPVDWKSGSTKT